MSSEVALVKEIKSRLDKISKMKKKIKGLHAGISAKESEIAELEEQLTKIQKRKIKMAQNKSPFSILLNIRNR